MSQTVHQCPPGGEYETPCCGVPLLELPRTDRVTLDADSVTCDKEAVR